MNAAARKFLSKWMPLAIILAVALPLLADGGDPPARVARLAYLQGTVSVQPSSVNQWSEAEPNYPVATGDRVYADQDGRVELQIGQTVTRLWHGTDLTMTNLSDDLIQMGLAQGTVRVRTFGLDPREQVEIDTPNGAITIVRPGDIRIDCYAGDDGTVVTVNSGEVQITGPNLSQNVGQGQAVQLVGSNPIQIASVAIAPVDEFDSFSLTRDRNIENSASARYVSRDTVGYDDLDANGDWTPQSDYGPVWYPRAVPVDWVPYRYGHWVWTGPWGWTWVEDEPWGYAPFHYGRWVNIHNRWGWVPGPVAVRPIWSPALVAFVGGPHFGIGVSVGVSAWFPLGPGEVYNPWYHCSPRYVNQVNITNIHVTNVIHAEHDYYNTTVINNARYVNRQVAVTAVRGDAFASARPVHQNMVRMQQQELEQAQIIQHPSMRPTVQAVVPRPQNRPMPVASTRPTLLTQGGHQQQASPGAHQQAVPYKQLPPNAMQNAEAATRPNNQGGHQNPYSVQGQTQQGQTQQGQVRGQQNGQQFGQNPNPQQPAAIDNAHRQGAPAQNQQQYNQQQQNMRQPAQGNQPQNVQQQGGRPVYQQQPLITHNESPAPKPTFQQQQPALNQHPGRPLEPQQIENIQQGRPAGKPVDQELAPHSAPPQQHINTPPQQQQDQQRQYQQQLQLQQQQQQQQQRMQQQQQQQQLQQQQRVQQQQQQQRQVQQERTYTPPPQYQAAPQQQHAAPPPQQQQQQQQQQQHQAAPPPRDEKKHEESSPR